MNIFTYREPPLTQKQSDRAMEIVADYMSWTADTGPMPFDTKGVWFKRVCAMAETIARLEDRKDAAGKAYNETWIRVRRYVEANVPCMIDDLIGIVANGSTPAYTNNLSLGQLAPCDAVARLQHVRRHQRGECRADERTAMTDEEIDNLAKLERAATPAPWEADGTKSDGEWGCGDDTRAGFTAREIIATVADRPIVLFDSLNSTAAEIEEYQDDERYQAFDRIGLANADLIVAMRNALPGLLADMKEYRDALNDVAMSGQAFVGETFRLRAKLARIDTILSSSRVPGEGDMTPAEKALVEIAGIVVESPRVGWTGRKCIACKGHGVVSPDDKRCDACGGTGDEYRTAIEISEGSTHVGRA